jgi:hypothetical protein
MITPRSLPISALFGALIAVPAFAQQSEPQQPLQVAVAETARVEAPAPADSTTKPAAPAAALTPAIRVQNVRPMDQRGINTFEAPKDDGVPYEGFKLDWNAAFAQQFQTMGHENSAAPRMAKDAAGKEYNANQLMDIGWGFNLPTANLGLNAQLAPGIRVALETYLSSRHHQETWVKGGYLQIDQSPIDHPVLNSIMDVVTIKAGMFPLNYGDAHFRRSDNGQVMHNPFVGNLILDAWTFEPGAEVYLRKSGFMAMGAVTSGSNKGDVTVPEKRGPAFYGKLGMDRRLSDLLRVRLTGSYYRADKTPTLYFGDRAGSRYYMVLENTVATTSAQFTSGLVNPAFSNHVRAFQVNPFVRFGGLELFGVIERAEGRTAAETAHRTVNQYSGDVIYRLLNDRLYVGGRRNTVEGEIPIGGKSHDVGIERTALAAGWYVTPTILLKGEYVKQQYNDFPSTDIRSGGRFDGFVIEGAVSF